MSLDELRQLASEASQFNTAAERYKAAAVKLNSAVATSSNWSDTHIALTGPYGNKTAVEVMHSVLDGLRDEIMRVVALKLNALEAENMLKASQCLAAIDARIIPLPEEHQP